MATSKQKESLKTIFSELEKISEWFGDEELDIDEALNKYKRGIELITLARKHLKKTENEFRVVAKKSKE